MSAGFDRGLDDFALLVHDVTGPVKDVAAGCIETIFANNKCLGRLVIGRRAVLTCHFDDRPGHRYFFGGTFPGPFPLRLWLRKCQRRQHPGGGADRRRRRPDRAAGASAARRRRRALHLRLDRFRRRPEDRLDQCRHPPPDAARPHRGRRRPQLAERPARALRGERGGRQAGAGRVRGRLAPDRSPRGGDAAADGRPRADLAPARARRCRW